MILLYSPQGRENIKSQSSYSASLKQELAFSTLRIMLQNPRHPLTPWGQSCQFYWRETRGSRAEGYNSSCHSGAIIKIRREELHFVVGPVPCSTCAPHHLAYLTALFHLEWLDPDFITTHPFFWGLPPPASLWRAKKQKWKVYAT